VKKAAACMGCRLLFAKYDYCENGMRFYKKFGFGGFSSTKNGDSNDNNIII